MQNFLFTSTLFGSILVYQLAHVLQCLSQSTYLSLIFDDTALAYLLADHRRTTLHQIQNLRIFFSKPNLAWFRVYPVVFSHLNIFALLSGTRREVKCPNIHFSCAIHKKDIQIFNKRLQASHRFCSYIKKQLANCHYIQIYPCWLSWAFQTAGSANRQPITSYLPVSIWESSKLGININILIKIAFLKMKEQLWLVSIGIMYRSIHQSNY